VRRGIRTRRKACEAGIIAPRPQALRRVAGNAITVDIMSILPMISMMMATAIGDLRGDEGAAASGREHGGAARDIILFGAVVALGFTGLFMCSR
jgi:hypothetical protein